MQFPSWGKYPQEAGQEGAVRIRIKERKLINTWDWMEHFCVVFFLSVAPPRRSEVTYLDGKIRKYKLNRGGSAPLASSWK